MAQNKLLVQIITLIAVVGVVAFIGMNAQETVNPTASESLNNSQSEFSTDPFATHDVSKNETLKGGQSAEDIAPVESKRSTESSEVIGITTVDKSTTGNILAILKDVGEAAYDHFGLTKDDFLKIKQAGFDVIEGNFDICAPDADVKFFLDSAEEAGLRVILNAGSGEAEWGYTCDGNLEPGQKPVWQRERVEAWVEKWKAYPALYAWDTSNEDGGTFPFGAGGVTPDPAWETKYSLSVGKLSQAYADVKSFDPSHPILIRMNGWYFYDNTGNFFGPGNSFGKDVADIVMINAYSNVDGYFDDFVSTVLMRATRSMYAIDPDVRMIPALGVWSEPTTWIKPTREHLINDYNQALKAENLEGIAFFKYGASEGKDWFLPDATRGDPMLWQMIRELNK